MGFEHPEVVHYQELTDGYTYFVMFGQATQTVDYASLSDEGFDVEYMCEDEIEAFARSHIGRPIVVVGAAPGTDTHSVGIDAMLNLKGFHGHHGLEGYRAFETHNLGSQVPNSVLVVARDRPRRRRDPRLADGHAAEPAHRQPDRARGDRRSRGQAQAADPHLRRPARLQRAGQGAGLRRRLLEGHLPATTWRASSCASWPRASTRRPGPPGGLVNGAAPATVRLPAHRWLAGGRLGSASCSPARARSRSSGWRRTRARRWRWRRSCASTPRAGGWSASPRSGATARSTT